MAAAGALPADIDDTIARLAEHGYLADRSLATALFLALRLERPLFLEGEPGTGKTEIAKTVAAALGRPLIRLQCHEGLDLASAAYEWDHPRQMIEIRLAEATGERSAASREQLAQELYSSRFLIRRPLLQAIDPQNATPPVLLIDELDRADEPFEAYLLELLSDFQITIPELGTIRASAPPIVVLTSNRTREVHDALKRRCLYHWLELPGFERELAIVRRRVPGIEATLAQQIVGFVQQLRGADLFKRPGIAETIEWSRALLELDAIELDPATVDHTLGLLLKYQDDIAKMQGSEAARIVEQVKTAAGGLMLLPALDARPGHLAANVVHFARVLRTAGLSVAQDRVQLALRALPLAGLESRLDFHSTLAACFVARPEQRALFDQAFHIFWRDPDLLGRVMAMLLPRVEGPPRGAPPRENRRLAAALFPHATKPRERPDEAPQPIELDARLTASDAEVLRKADFETMSTDEWAQARRLLPAIAAFSEPLRTRRGKPASRPGRIDWRATLRATARRADAIELQWREPRDKPAPLVVLADISGSMSHYSRMLLHFAHAVGSRRTRGAPPLASFVFGTRLTPITRLMAERDADLAIEQVVRAVEDWSGGTRISACLHDFNRDWSRRVLGGGATVLLVTDGLERGDTASLAFEIERLHKSCRRLVWLNPLLRYEGFEPRAAGIKAMLPHVDRMLSAHNLESLADLARLLAATPSSHRP